MLANREYCCTCIFRPKPIIDSDFIRLLIPICSGQIWPSVGIRDRIVGIGEPVVGIPRLSR